MFESSRAYRPSDRAVIAALATMLCVALAVFAAPAAQAAPASNTCSAKAAFGMPAVPQCEIDVQCPSASGCSLLVSNVVKGIGLIEGRAQVGGSLGVCGSGDLLPFTLVQCTVALSQEVAPFASKNVYCWANAYALNATVACKAQMYSH